MRRIRLAVVGIFVLSLIAFIVFNIVNRVTTDSTPPVITSESDTVTVSVAAEESELLAGLTAADDEDGDLTGEIMISSMSNFTEPGKRTVSYVVFDASNNASTLTRNLEYTDYTAPQIKLTQPLRYSLNEMEDASLTENMSVQDCLDGDITQQIRATFNDGHNGAGEQQRGRYLFCPAHSHSYGSGRGKREILSDVIGLHRLCPCRRICGSDVAPDRAGEQLDTVSLRRRQSFCARRD